MHLSQITDKTRIIVCISFLISNLYSKFLNDGYEKERLTQKNH